MSDFTISEVVDAFYYTKATKPDFRDEFYDLADIGAATESYLAQLPGTKIADSAEPVSISAKRFLSSLMNAGCFVVKEVPFAQPVYKFVQGRYEGHRSTFLKGSPVFEQAKDYRGYFPRAFEGYVLELEEKRAGGIGETVPRGELVKVDWEGVAERQTANSIQTISGKVIELATAIQQAELDQVLRSKLLARVRAVDALLKADEPEWPEIVNLLNYPYMTAFLNAYAIIDIILGLSS